MAIYNNRLVRINGNPQLETRLPLTISVINDKGEYFTVAPNTVKFTKDEIKAMSRNLEQNAKDKIPYVLEATDEELEAAKLGISPATDPELKQQAMIKVQQEKAEEASRKANEKAKAEAEKEFEANKKAVK